eukprot:206440_1
MHCARYEEYVKEKPHNAFGNIHIEVRKKAYLSNFALKSGDVDIKCDGTIICKISSNPKHIVALRNNIKIKTTKLMISESSFIQQMRAWNRTQICFNQLLIQKKWGYTIERLTQ